MDEKPKIMIGILWRNREWIVKRVLDSILALDYPKDRIYLNFIINDCRDNTKNAILEYLQHNYPTAPQFAGFSMQEFNLGTPEDGRTAAQRHVTIRTMAALKNLLLLSAQYAEVDHLLYMDSDIILSPEFLKTALSFADYKRIIAAPVVTGICAWNFLKFNKERDEFYRDNTIPAGEPFSVDFASGLLLIPNYAFSKGWFTPEDTGDDCGFMRDMMREGIQVLMVPQAKAEHVMNKPVQEKAIV